MSEPVPEDLWRALAPQVIAALVRRHGDFGSAEDAVQDALVAAARQWPEDGVPEHPRAWLVTVASRRLVDRWRSDRARVEREHRQGPHVADLVAPAADAALDGRDLDRDDSLALLLLCCHPALSRLSQVALTLRAVSGLSTAQVAHAFLVPEATMAQRISRAKATLREIDAPFAAPPASEIPDRVIGVAQVLYLVFSEGHTSTTGGALVDVSLAEEAIRLTRLLRALVPEADEVTGLLALMLLTHARRRTRTSPDGALIPLAEQDRDRWDRLLIGEGVAMVESVLGQGPVGPYQLQAAIAAVHAEATLASDTDWEQIEVLYGMLAELLPTPVVALNHAVARAEASGPQAGLAALEPLLADPALRRQHRVHAVHAHVLERAGRHEEARAAYETAARLATSRPEQRYLQQQVGRLTRGTTR